MNAKPVRPVLIPRNMHGRLANVPREDGTGIACRVLLSDDGVLAREVARETGLPFNPMDFAMGVIDPDRRFR